MDVHLERLRGVGRPCGLVRGRDPGQPEPGPTYNLRLQSIQALFAEMFLGRPFPSEDSKVFLDDWLKTERAPEPEPRVQRPMPDFGARDGAC